MIFDDLVAKSRFPPGFEARTTWHEIGTARQSGWWTHTAFAGTCPLALEFGTPCNGSRPRLSFLRHQGIYCVFPASRRRTALAVRPINTCRVQLYGQTKAPAWARRNLARSQSPQPTALPLRTYPRLRRREVSHHKQVSAQAAASRAGACRRTAGHSSNPVTATIPIMLGNQNRSRAPPLAAKKRAASRELVRR